MLYVYARGAKTADDAHFPPSSTVSYSTSRSRFAESNPACNNAYSRALHVISDATVPRRIVVVVSRKLLPRAAPPRVLYIQTSRLQELISLARRFAQRRESCDCIKGRNRIGECVDWLSWSKRMKVGWFFCAAGWLMLH